MIILVFLKQAACSSTGCLQRKEKPVPDVHEEPAGGMKTAVAEGDQMEMLLEADPINLDNMTKLELETYGRTLGIELDRRKSKADLINTLNEG